MSSRFRARFLVEWHSGTRGLEWLVGIPPSLVASYGGHGRVLKGVKGGDLDLLFGHIINGIIYQKTINLSRTNSLLRRH